MVSFLCGNVAPDSRLHTKSGRLVGMRACSFLREGTCAVCHAVVAAGCVTERKSPPPVGASDVGGSLRRELMGAVQCDGVGGCRGPWGHRGEASNPVKAHASGGCLLG